MFKKSFSVLVVILLMTASLLAVHAGSYDDVLKAATFSTVAEYTDGDLGTYQMRGFTASEDGMYLYGGLLQGDRMVYKFLAKDGSIVATYKDAELGYGKGLATDDRGNLYVGLTNSSSDGSVAFACVDSNMKELSVTKIDIEGKVGINGVAVVKNADKYYLYFVTNYGPNTIRCYDVTNPAAPTVVSTFGENGIVDIKALCGNDVAEGNYIAVDENLRIYLTANADGNGSKGDSVLLISADGKTIEKKVAIPEAYGVAVINGESVLVSTYAGASSSIFILNAADLSSIGEIGALGDAANYTGVAFVNNRIYIADQGFSDTGDRILVSNEIVVPTPETAAPETVAPQAEAPAPVMENVPETPVAPQTADNLLFVVAALLLSSIGAICIYKKER